MRGYNWRKPMTNIGPNLIHAMDLVNLNKINGLNEATVTVDKCPTCASSGFAPSVLPDQCEFCDGTEGGLGPIEISKAEMMTAMYGSELRPHQKELLYNLMESNFVEIERRIDHNIRGYAKPILQHEYFHQMYGGTITGRSPKPTMVIIDEWSDIYRDLDFTPDNRDEKDWKRTQFKQDILSSTPSAAKRAKLRAKRKKRK
jgi:hypothetical protein